MGAVGGPALSPLFEQAWRRFFRKGEERAAEKDRLLAKIETQCAELREVACQYWNSSASELGKDNNLLMGRLLGLQHEISGLNARLFRDDRVAREASTEALSHLMDEVTGGDFGEPQRAMQPQFLAAINIAEAKYRGSVQDFCMV